MTDLKRLRDAIDDRGLKDTWIAEKLGLTKQAFSNKMNGKRDFSRKQIANLIHLLDLADSEAVEIFLS